MIQTNSSLPSHAPAGSGPLVVGVDVGGTKIAAGVVDALQQDVGILGAAALVAVRRVDVKV